MKNGNYKAKVCIVGLGPAGIATAITLSKSNIASRVICLDAGDDLSIRSCSILQNKSCKKEKPCGLISGFGGCSLLSGGKISNFPAGSKLANILGSTDLTKIKLSEAFGLFNNYLHLQESNITINDIKSARELFGKLGFKYRYYDAYVYNPEELQRAYHEISRQLKSVGLSLLLNTELVDIFHEENGFKLMARQGGQNFTIFTKYLVLGVGRLGRNMLRSLNTKLSLGGKENHLDVGVRLEFPISLYPDINKYHNDLKLLFKNARTFCACKDGKVAPYLLEDMFFMEGYYNPRYKSGFTNLGILIRLRLSKRNITIFDEIKKKTLQIGGGKPVSQKLSDYLGTVTKDYKSSKCVDSSISFWASGDVNKCFPQSINIKIKEAVDYFASRLLPKDYWDEINVFAPEIDYSGLSFPVAPNFSIIPRLYLIGDCCGRFRGILQSACSGIICAESIIGDENEKKS